jgi:hypothetical protein
MPNEPHNEVDVFISYNRADEVWARELATRIEREKVDEKSDSRLLKVFFAPWDVDVGENLVNRINDGLAKAKFVALIMSPEFFKSAWTNLEWTHLVALDPINQVRRIMPVLHRSEGQKNKNERIEPPAPFRVLNWIDFRKQHEFETQFRKLIRRVRGQRPERGEAGTPSVIASSNSFSPLHEYALPDSLPEILLSNLLPVANVPARIWSGETELTKSKEVFQVVPGADAFLLKDKRLYTFAQLTDKLCPLRKVLDAASIGMPENRDEWLSDPDKPRSYLGLLNKCLKYELGRQRIFRDEKGRFFFPPNKDGTTRIVVHRGDRSREVAAKKMHKDGAFFGCTTQHEFVLSFMVNDFFCVLNRHFSSRRTVTLRLMVKVWGDSRFNGVVNSGMWTSFGHLFFGSKFYPAIQRKYELVRELTLSKLRLCLPLHG